MNTADRIKEISGVQPLKCMKCGKCSASCPSYNEMDIKPHQFVTYVINDDVEALANSKSAWKCLSCFACIERCPRNVQPGKLIDAAKREEADYAVDIYPHYGSDVEATLRAGNDVLHGLIGAGVYASHGYERSHKDGVENNSTLFNKCDRFVTAAEYTGKGK